MTVRAFRTMLVGIVVVGCHGATPPAPRERPPEREAPPLALSSSPTAPAPVEDGSLVTDGTAIAVELLGVELLDERHAVSRDSQNRLRTREIAPREVRGNDRDPVRLALGERASFGTWDVRWIAVREGLIRLEGRYRAKPAGEWSASVDDRLATHELRTHDGLFTFEVRLVAMHGRSDRADGRVDIIARETDVAPSVKFGQSLSPGVFRFPDGLRVHVEQIYGCDFDVSAPCPFGGTYRVDAALDQQETHVELKSKLTKILNHTLELGRGNFVVRK